MDGISRLKEATAAYGSGGTAIWRRPPSVVSRPSIAEPERGPRPADEASTATRNQSVGDRLREMYEKRESGEFEADINQLVVETNQNLEMSNRSLRFRINDQSEEIQIQVVDSDRDRVIRSIPTDEMIALSLRMRDLAGLGAMVDHSR